MDVKLEQDNERTFELRLLSASKNKEGFSFSALTLKNTYDMRYVQGNHIIESKYIRGKCILNDSEQRFVKKRGVGTLFVKDEKTYHQGSCKCGTFYFSYNAI